MPDLILIDGSPGSGKTTVSTTLAAKLAGCSLLLEMDADHPLHPAPVSAIGADFTGLDGMRNDELSHLLLTKWKAFLAAMASSEAKVIVESYPFQSHVRVLWQNNAGVEVISAWLAELYAMLKPHDPALVMLHLGDRSGHLQEVFAARGPEWMDFIVDFAQATPYAKARGLTCLDGAWQFLGDYLAAMERWSLAWPFARIDLAAWQNPPDQQCDRILSELRLR